MRRFLGLYQFLVPLVLFPLAYWLWLRQFGSHTFVVFGMAIPIVFAYVIPGIGTNVLGLWEINTRFRLGKFRPHHGFMFGTGTALLALPCFVSPASAIFSWGAWLQAGFLVGTVLAFWNWVYDLAAIGSGFITVYNQPYADGKGTEAVVADYAPVYFGVFGWVYGLVIYLGQVLLLGQGRWEWLYPLLAVGCAAGLVLPSLAYVACSYWRHGHNGLKAFRTAPPVEARQRAQAPPLEV